MRLRFQYTLSLQLALIFATAMILMQVLVLSLDRRFTNELEFNRRLGESRSVAANIVELLPNLPEDLRFLTVRSFSLRGEQYFLLDMPEAGPDAEHLPQLEAETKDWVERRGLPVSEVYAAQNQFAWTGGPGRPLPGTHRDRFSSVFFLGDKPPRRMANLVDEAPLWVPLPPPLGHPPIPNRLENAQSIDYYPVVTIAMKLEETGKWVTAYRFLRPLPNNAFVTQIYVSILGMIAIAAVALLIGRRVMRPFTRLARSAEQLGRGEKGDQVPLAGPSDMQSVIMAFNRMTGRVSHSIDYQIGLLRSLGHDIKGPLEATQRLLKDVQPDGTRAQIEGRLDSVRSIVNSIMSFSRAVMRDGPLQPTDLGELLETLVDEQKDLGATASLSAPQTLPVTCRVKATERALRNLIENAVKYGGEARVTVFVEDDDAVVWIDDTGPGLPEDLLEEVFAPFQRYGKDSDGTGLGLAIARTIAVDQGGAVHLENRPGGGLRAEFRVPRN